MTIVSEASDQCFMCFNKVVGSIRSKMAEPMWKIFVWSDGMSAQFRSRFVFKLLTAFDITIDLEWHYMEAHHGKGPMDGVG